MDTNQWPQGIGLVKPIEESSQTQTGERKPRPQKEQALNCPRCNSTNTKFCYYNNYSLSQPRYFCKTCRRYWTEGGTLRNVPVGGGSRKNKRSSASTTSSSSQAPAAKKIPDLSHLTTTTTGPGFPLQNPNKIHESQDLNLAYPPTANYATSLSGLFHQFPYVSTTNTTESTHSQKSGFEDEVANPMTPTALELLKSNNVGIPPPNDLSSVISMPTISVSYAFYSSVQDFIKPKLNFSLDGFDMNGYGGLHNTEAAARLFLPCEDLKPNSTKSGDHYDQQHQQNRGQQEESTNGYWNGMLGGGSPWLYH